MLFTGYVYSIQNLKRKAVRYVGSTTRPLQRFAQHKSQLLDSIGREELDKLTFVIEHKFTMQLNIEDYDVFKLHLRLAEQYFISKLNPFKNKNRAIQDPANKKERSRRYYRINRAWILAKQNAYNQTHKEQINAPENCEHCGKSYTHANRWNHLKRCHQALASL